MEGARVVGGKGKEKKRKREEGGEREGEEDGKGSPPWTKADLSTGSACSYILLYNKERHA